MPVSEQKGLGLALGCVAVLALAWCRAPHDGSSSTALKSAPVRVGAEDIVIVQRQAISEGPSLSGTLRARSEATVRAEIAGQVVGTFADEGVRVRRGQVLARIDPGALGTARRSAQTGVTSARNALATAEGQAARQEELAREEVTSPIDGVVSERSVSRGDVVQVGASLFTVVDNSALQLDAAVPAEDLAAIRVGMPVTFEVSGFEGRPITGRVARINPVADPATRQVEVFVDIPNDDHALVGGLYAQGRVMSASRVGLVVPTAAVDRSDPTFLVRLDDGHVSRVPVKIGVMDEKNDRVEVRGAVQAGDRVLVGASRELTPGTLVEAAGGPAPTSPSTGAGGAVAGAAR